MTYLNNLFNKGSFKYDLVCEVIDKLVDKNNPLLILDRGISEISLQLTGNAIELKKIAIPKYSGGNDLNLIFFDLK